MSIFVGAFTTLMIAITATIIGQNVKANTDSEFIKWFSIIAVTITLHLIRLGG